MKEYLMDSPKLVTFVKKNDEIRKMFCEYYTTDADDFHPNVLTVYDLEKNDVRRFCLDRIISIEDSV